MKDDEQTPTKNKCIKCAYTKEIEKFHNDIKQRNEHLESLNKRLIMTNKFLWKQIGESKKHPN